MAGWFNPVSCERSCDFLATPDRGDESSRLCGDTPGLQRCGGVTSAALAAIRTVTTPSCTAHKTPEKMTRWKRKGKKNPAINAQVLHFSLLLLSNHHLPPSEFCSPSRKKTLNKAQSRSVDCIVKKRIYMSLLMALLVTHSFHTQTRLLSESTTLATHLPANFLQHAKLLWDWEPALTSQWSQAKHSPPHPPHIYFFQRIFKSISFASLCN